ncbi:TetR/AcrR family transcriptional regulator [Pediococcus pentosaceus]|uniref:TetR/AcrR family transcriptional regulator n=1 Tax=Pediococcus pentosaceus TaxID=1255 RepID=UPI0018E19A80|nr:TetR/AcrR family transcriptional regulator [Pediococcus pentosaceus]MBF7104348.1 TetR/AcrR family transcriptional regulator [Pediococcus pentosaceus]QQC61230.1 TetR/AcrR family transcriptional regulator [Pediococcus pentosaceus]
MKLNGYEDLRVQRTINSIYQAFEKLITQKDYAKITVTELAKQAQINKKTFYRYYETLDNLLAEMQAHYAQEYLEEVKDYQYPEDLEKSVASFFNYSAKQGLAFDRITTSQNYTGIRQQMINQVLNKTWRQLPEFNRLNDWQKKILLGFIEQTGLSIYQQWSLNGREQPLEEVIQEAQRLMRGGVNNYL